MAALAPSVRDAVRRRGNARAARYFDDFERIAALMTQPSFSISHPSFLSTLQRLDECIKYMQLHAHYHDAESYGAKYRQLHIRALVMIKTHIVQTLQRTAGTILAAQSAADADVRAGRPASKPADPSAAYINFKAMSDHVRTLMTELVQVRARASESDASGTISHT